MAMKIFSIWTYIIAITLIGNFIKLFFKNKS